MKALVISVDKKNYLIHLDPVIRVASMGDLFTQPNSPGFLKGIARFREEPVPIIDLPERFGVSKPVEPGIHSCFIIVKGSRGTIGLYADSANDILEIPESKSSTGKKLTPVKINDRDYSLFNPEDLLNKKEWRQLDNFISEL